MSRIVRAAALAAVAVLALSGCIRQSAYYAIQNDDTVDGIIYTGLKADYLTESDPYKGTGAGDIAAQFAHATITGPFTDSWGTGYQVAFVDEPLASFADPITPDIQHAWDIQITKTGGAYEVWGLEPSVVEPNRTTIVDAAGSLTLTVVFPGDLIGSTGANATGIPAPGWAYFDILNGVEKPYAKGGSGYVLGSPPDLGGLVIPGLEGVTGPDPEPAPVVTVVITPDPEPAATPSASVTPSASPAVIAPGPGGASSSGIPAWVWAVGGALLVVVAGLVGVMVANRKPKGPAAAVAVPATTAPAAAAPATTAPAATAPTATTPDVKPNTDADPTI